MQSIKPVHRAPFLSRPHRSKNEVTTLKSRSEANNRSRLSCPNILRRRELQDHDIVPLAITTHPTSHTTSGTPSVMTALFKSLMHQSSRSQPPTIRQDLCEVSRSGRFRRPPREGILIHRQTCGKRPKFVEKDGTAHPYCGRTCAKAQQPTCKLPSCKESGKSAFSGFCSPRHAR